MKLRLENGNFKIVETLNPDESYSYNKLPKGLLPCDFLGCVVERAELSVVTTIMSAGEVEDTPLFVLSSSDGFQLFYNPLTGEVTTADASGGSGGGSGAGGLVVNARYDNEKYILDKTFGELYDAYASGTMIIVHTVYNHPEAPDSDKFEYVKELHTDYDTYSGKWSASVGSYSVDSQNTFEEMRNSYPYMTE